MGDSEPTRRETTRRVLTRRGLTERAPAAVLALGLVGTVVLLATQARQLYFFGDDWDFLLHRELGWDSLMRPHNEHWSTLPIVVFRVMVAIFGIDHYLAYGLMPILVHALCCALLYAVMRRNELPAWPAVVLVVPFAFLVGRIGENPLWDFQIGFLGSAAFGLVALLLHSGDSARRMPLAWGASVLSLTCSGMAMPMLVWLGAYLLVRRELRRAVLATAPPAVVALAWYVGYGRNATAQAPTATPGEVLRFAVTGLGDLWERVLMVPFSGFVVLVLIIAAALLAPLSRPQRALAVSGVATVFATYLSVGVSRAALGADAALVGRYSWFGLLFTLPAAVAGLAFLAERARARPRVQVAAAVVLIEVLTAIGIEQTLHFTHRRTGVTEAAQVRIPATLRLIDEGAPLLAQEVAPPFNVGLTVDALRSPEVRSAFPEPRPGPQARLDASATVQVGAATAPLDLPAATDVTTRGAVEGAVGPGCSELDVTGDAWLELPAVSTGSQVALTSDAETYRVRLISESLRSAPVELLTEPGTQTYVATVSTLGTLRVLLPPGQVTVCL